MSRSRFLLPLLAVLAMLTSVAGACSSDKKADETKKTTTTEQDAATTTTVSDATFAATVDEARKQLEAAGTDPCKVIAVYQSAGTSMNNPATTAQRKEATALAVSFFNALADAAPKDLAAEAATIHKVSGQLEQEGKDTNWSSEFMKGPKSITQNKDFEQAATKVSSEIARTCMPNSGAGPQDAAPSTVAP